MFHSRQNMQRKCKLSFKRRQKVHKCDYQLHHVHFNSSFQNLISLMFINKWPIDPRHLTFPWLEASEARGQRLTYQSTQTSNEGQPLSFEGKEGWGDECQVWVKAVKYLALTALPDFIITRLCQHCTSNPAFSHIQQSLKALTQNHCFFSKKKRKKLRRLICCQQLSVIVSSTFLSFFFFTRLMMKLPSF